MTTRVLLEPKDKADLIDTIEHIGWTSKDRMLFEEFWCKLLKFELIKTSEIDSALTKALFGFEGGAKVYRYRRPVIGGFCLCPDIEIHVFNNPPVDCSLAYNRMGISHVCIKVTDKDKFLELIKSFPKQVLYSKYDNPGGWTNLFIRDYEGNWIEVRS